MGRVSACAVAVAAAFCLTSSALGAPADSLQDFRVLVAQELRAKYPGVKIALLGQDGLSVTMPGGREQDQSLRRPFELYRDDPQMRPEIIRNLVASYAPIRVQPEKLVVLVRSVDSFPGGLEGRDLLVRPLVGRLVAVVAVDAPDAYSFSSGEVLKTALGLEEPTIWSRAVANTRRHTRVEPRPFQPGQVVRLSTGMGLASSLLADDAFWDSPQMTSAGPIVVAPLARDEIYLTPLRETERVAALRQEMKDVAGDPNNLAEGLIVRRNGRWEVLP